MSTLPKLFFIILIVSLALPVLADQSATGSITGNGNTQVIGNINAENGYVQQQKNYETNNAYITVQAPADNVPAVNLLDVGSVDESRMMYPGEVLSFPASDDMTFSIRSAAPIAVYTIGPGNDRLLLDSSESMLTYDPIYHRFDHGVVAPLYIFPQFTTRCIITTHSNGYIVMDNRYFPDYTIVEIRSS